MAAYWLGKQLGKPEAAFRVLDEAQANNPFDYRVHLEKGVLHMYLKEWKEAAREFDAGLAFWPRPLAANSEDARMDKRSLLLHRGLLYEREGRNAEAVRAYRAILKLYPKMQGGLPERIAALEQNRQPAVPAQTILESLAAKPTRKYTICHRHENKGAAETGGPETYRGPDLH